MVDASLFQIAPYSLAALNEVGKKASSVCSAVTGILKAQQVNPDSWVQARIAKKEVICRK
jgi:hypothetical protein